MKKTVTLILAGILLFSAAFPVFSGGKTEQAEEKHVMKFGHVLQTDHAYHLMALKFKEELEKASAGRIEIQVFPAGQLGNERDLVEGLQLGTVDISTITSALTARFVPEFKVFSLPFLFRDFNHMFQVMDGPLGRKLEKDMEAKGLVKLGFVSGGSRSMYARQPVRNLGDLKGKKIRTMEDPIYLDTWNALGALATPIPWGDVYLSLDQGIVDGAEGALISYQSMGFFDPSPHVTVIDYIFSWHNFMMSRTSWGRLSAPSQKLLMDAAKIATKFERDYVVDVEKQLLEVLKTKHGAKVYYPEDIEQWRKAVAGIYQKRAADVGGMDLINQILNTGK